MLHKIIHTLSTLLLLLSTSMTFAAKADKTDAPSKGMEKCYGIAKAGQNDCHTTTTTCAGSSKFDNQKDAWIGLPQGTCQRIVGGVVQDS